MVSQCPQMATSAGVTLMLGGQYEIAAVATWINSFYIGIGTGNINFNIGNSSAGISFAFNVSGAVYTDLCGGGGPNAGLELGFAVGAAITGTSDDLLECSFLFDFDAGVGSSFGGDLIHSAVFYFFHSIPTRTSCSHCPNVWKKFYCFFNTLSR